MKLRALLAPALPLVPFQAPAAPLLALAAALVPLLGCAGGDTRGAAPSGQLTLYVAQAPEMVDPVLAAFRSRTGIAAETVHGGMGELLSRIRAERERPLGDALWGGSPEMYALNADLFAPFESGEEDAYERRDPAGKWHPFSHNVIYLVVNTARARGPRPKSFRALLDPRIAAQGPVGFPNPAVSGTGYTIVTALEETLGWDFIVALLRRAWLTDSSDSVFKWVKDGETAYGFLFETTLRDYLAAGAALEPVLTEEGLIAQADGMGLVAGAPHADAARRFLSFLASAEAHMIVRESAGRRSARRDVTPAPGLLDLGGQRLIEPDPLRLSREREAILARFEQVRAAR